MAEKIKTYDIKYLPTGNVFTLTKEECDRLVANEGENFQVVDKNYTAPTAEDKKPTLKELLIEDDKKGEDENIYSKLPNKDAVKAELVKREIEFDENLTRKELEKLLIEDDKKGE